MLDLKSLSHDDWIRLYDQAKNFLGSNLWEYIKAMVELEREGIFAELANVSPYDAKKIIELQNDLRIAEKAPQWIMDLITQGEQLLQERMMHDQEETGEGE